MNSIPHHVIRNDDTIRAFRDLFLNDDDDDDDDEHFAFGTKDGINADVTGEESVDNDNLMGNHIDIGNILTFHEVVSFLLIKRVVCGVNKKVYPTFVLYYTESTL